MATSPNGEAIFVSKAENLLQAWVIVWGSPYVFNDSKLASEARPVSRVYDRGAWLKLGSKAHGLQVFAICDGGEEWRLEHGVSPYAA